MFWFFALMFVVAVVSIILKDNFESEETKKSNSSLPLSVISRLKKTSISEEEFEEMRASMDSKFTFNDVIWAIYNKRSLSYFRRKSFGLYRNNFLEMSTFCHREKNYKQELMFLLKVLYCDLSGNYNSGMIDDKNSISLAPGVIKRLKKVEGYYIDKMIDECFKIPFRFNYCDKELFTEILNEIFNLEEYNGDILKKYLPKMKEKPKIDYDY